MNEASQNIEEKLYQCSWIQQQTNKYTQTQSQFIEFYQRSIQKIEINHQQTFMKNDIIYDKSSNYEQFHFNVERIVPCFDFYRLHIKIAHFKIIANVAKYPFFRINQIFSNNQSQKFSHNNNIYFAEVYGKSLCFKINRFRNDTQFILNFVRFVKQWAILKICSVLEVSPYMQNYLGFDIIINKNCIMFAMQKGRQISFLNDQQLKQLQKQLRLMHQFKIIHCDIKPDNIVFSQYLNKPVFIDFGFSEIIKEEIGYKKLTSFKGTPNFCSPEMLSLMINNQNFIDMYYNDAYSFRQTCKYCRFKKSRVETILIEYELQNEHQYQYIQYSNSNNKMDLSDFIFCLIQFHYVTNNQLKLRPLIKQYIQINTQNIKKLLLFIKKAVKYIFFPTVFYQQLKIFERLAQYKQIEQKIKYLGEVLCFTRIITNQQENSSQSEVIYFSLQLYSNSLQQHQYDHYLKIILSTEQIEYIDHTIAMVFELVRFDQKNLQFKEKVIIAKKINPLLLAQMGYSQQNIYVNIIEENLDLKEIKVLIRTIFKYCIDPKPSKWAIEHLFDVFQQLIILNYQFQFIDTFFMFIDQHQSQFQHILICFQLRMLLESTTMFKFKREQYKIVCQKFQSYINNSKKKYSANRLYKNNEQQSILIHNIFSNLEANNKQFNLQSLQNYQTQLNLIKNPKIRKYLFYFIFYRIIKTQFQLGKTEKLLKLIQTKKSINIYNLNILHRIKILINLMYLTYNQSAIQSCYNYIYSVVNCPQIFQHFDTQRYLQKTDKSDFSSIDILIQKIPFVGGDIYFECYLVLWNWTEAEIKKDAQLYKKFIQLYYAYQKQKDKVRIDKQNMAQAYLSTFSKVTIQFYFYRFSSQTKGAFLSTLEQYERQLSYFQSKYSNSSQFQISFMRCRFFIYKYYLCLSSKEQQPCLFYLQQIERICQKVNINFLILQLARSLNYQSDIWNSKKILIYSTEMVFNYCSNNNEMVFYLRQACGQYFLRAIYTFARHNRPFFYQIILSLTRFLSQNSFHAARIYFINFLAVIDEFLQKDAQNSHLIHYSNFTQNDSSFNLKENPYLLIFYAYSLYNEQLNSQQKLLKIFAVHCIYLSSFARKKLLQKYYRVLVCFINTKSKRQKTYTFKEAKNYIGSRLRKKQTNFLIKHLKKSFFQKMFKGKINALLEIC